MPKTTRTVSKWRFSYSVVLPVILGAGATLATIVFFAIWATSKNDSDALIRQTNLVSHLLEDERGLISGEQEDVAAWDKAVEAVSGELDKEFIEGNFGFGMHDFFGHDRAYLLDPELHAVYAMRNGSSVDPSEFENERATLEPIAARLREINWQGALAAYANGSSEKVPNITDLVILDGEPAFVSFMPVVSQDDDIIIPPGGEFIHVTAEFLDAELAVELTALLLLDGARFGLPSETSDTDTSLMIRNNAGSAVAKFFWTPDRPGSRLINEIAPGMAGAAAIAGLVIAMLVFRLRKSTSELEASRARAQHTAYHDVLTGLGNRAKLESELSSTIADIDHRNGEQVALLMLDLDRFKQVNDTLGHDAGDELIRQVAHRLAPLVREHDTISRIGGDEFVIVAENINSENDIIALCKRIVSSIELPFDLEAGQAFVGVSIGVSIASHTNTDPLELRREADIALYAAKDGGRNQFKIFAEHMNAAVQARQELEADLRAALEHDGQLDVAFEPVVRADGNEVFGAEACIHWIHPEKGEIPKSLFMPIAESCGLVERIGDFVLERACEVGARTPGRRIAVRAYAAQLRNPQYFNKVSDLLDKTGMKPSDLEVEVSEKMMFAAEQVANRTLGKLRRIGVGIALNDFGTGFTSLRALQKFKVDRIKIDHGFINELAQSPDPEAITHAVVWLARAVGVEVTADCIEDSEQKDFLARMGCMSFQGPLFSPDGQADWLRLAASSAKKPTPNGEHGESRAAELWGTGA